jgi:hypothetical protein
LIFFADFFVAFIGWRLLKNAVAGQGIGGIVPSWREARGWEGAEKAEEEEGGGRRKEEEGGRKQVGLSS